MNRLHVASKTWNMYTAYIRQYSVMQIYEAFVLPTLYIIYYIIYLFILFRLLSNLASLFRVFFIFSDALLTL